MSNPKGGPAFPTISRTEIRPMMNNSGGNYEAKIPATDGMTLRDYFAAKIAAGDSAADEGWSSNVNDTTVLERARFYYRLADAMLIARDEQPQQDPA